MLQLSEIWIYPIKSLGGISISQAQVTDRGLVHDRRWLLIDENNRFLSQREHPQLALFQIALLEDKMQVVYKTNGSTIAFPLEMNNCKNPLSVTVWEDVMLGYEVSLEVSNWFSKILGFSVRLVYMPDESHRKVPQEYAVTPNDINSFSDGFPFLIIGQSSLDDLNSRLKTPIGMNRFRPNFVFTGGQAYEEDAWQEFLIGALTFYGVKPCSRCVMTTVDQEKGVLSGKEPLKTLAKYRMVDNAVLFGQNLIGPSKGQLFVGDVIKTTVRI